MKKLRRKNFRNRRERREKEKKKTEKRRNKEEEKGEAAITTVSGKGSSNSQIVYFPGCWTEDETERVRERESEGE